MLLPGASFDTSGAGSIPLSLSSQSYPQYPSAPMLAGTGAQLAQGASSGFSSLGGLGPAGLFAALIGLGKNTEANHPNTPIGQGLLTGLGPSISQVMADPKGMGLPTLLGMPFLTPFTSSKAAQATKPEWSGLFPFGF